MSELQLFPPITKIDEEKRLVYCVLTQECPYKSGEIFDYATEKPAVQAGLTRSKPLRAENPSATCR